ncbi:MAG: tRNA lysidine(34) synthetase TilS [Bacteroidales bacterium]|nr:tRNA lysidine(34) synthetase TilS [Bacteroidales bacterium]
MELHDLPLANETGTLLVGLSGGPDSVALLHRLHSEGYQVVATHCNFHLRGAESDRDEQFCRNFCLRLNVPLLVKEFDTRTYMQNKHVSLELAARELRYAWWNELLADGQQYDYLCLAHHLDDSIETALFNLMRGTGINGLTGIPAVNRHIIRPLSHVSRQEILSYLEQHHLDYVTDSTNLENEATRNQIRNRLLPLMEQILPQARHGIALTMQHLQTTRLLAEQRLDELFASTQLCTQDGVEWYEYKAENVFGSNSSPGTDFSTLFHYWQERYPNARQKGNLFYTEPPAEDLARQRCSFCQTWEDAPLPPFSADYELFDADKIQVPLCFRHWQEGDRLQPLGMQQSKLVSDLFTNAHYSPVRKALTWIVADASGRILWVVGLRVADWCKVTPDTRHVLKLSLSSD